MRTRQRVSTPECPLCRVRRLIKTLVLPATAPHNAAGQGAMALFVAVQAGAGGATCADCSATVDAFVATLDGPQRSILRGG